MEVKLPALLGNYDRLTDQPSTKQQTDDGQTGLSVIGKFRIFWSGKDYKGTHIYIIEVKLPHDLVSPLVGRSVGWLVGR